MGKPTNLCEASGRIGTRTRRLLGLGAMLFVPLAFAGCADLKGSAAAGPDPLLGGPPLKASAQAGSPNGTVATLPPLAPSSTTSTAALASLSRPLDGGRDLRIGTPRPDAPSDGWAGQGMTLVAEGHGAVLGPPQTAPVPAPVAAQTVSTGDRTISTYEQAKAELDARGALWQRLETDAETGLWKFSCALPNKQNPRLHRTYQAKAADSLAAIRAVFEQIDQQP